MFDGLYSRGNSVLRISYVRRLWWHGHIFLHVTAKGSSHKGLNRGTVQATDKTSNPREHPARSIEAEERRSTSEERLNENARKPQPAA
jgi:hypothetical protein